MRGIRYIAILLVFVGVQTSSAQDIHFSQTENAHLNLNPALAGFNTDFNMSINYKTQWNPTLAPFKTYAFAGDGVLNPRSKSNWKFAMGGMMFKDQAGTPQLGTAQVNGFFASKVKLSESSYLGAGLFLGYRQISIEQMDGEWGSQFDGQTYDASILSGESFDKMRRSSFNSGLGVAYHFESGNKSKIQNNAKSIDLGFSVYNLNKPKNSFLADSKDRLSHRYSAFVHSDLGLFGTILSLQPAVYYHRQGQFQEIVYGTALKLDMKKSGGYVGTMNNLSASIGLYHRWGDALITRIQLELADFKFGFSYDFNISSLQTSSRIRGGTELFLAYQIKSKGRR